MFLKIDLSSGVPIYRQIMDQIKYSIANGTLKPGGRIPSVRQLSLDLKINPNTVTKAFSELEHEQVIETRRGMGTFVTEKKIEIDQDVKWEILTRLAERLAVEAVHLDVAQGELQNLVNEILSRYTLRREEGESQ